jgi:tRNA dimethylallyltransferase
MKNKAKILVILGQTATGKSDLAVFLAKKLNGEIISADSRQVYKGLDIGSGKITKREMKGVPHYLLDVISPKKVFSVADFQKQTYKHIDDILKRGKLPIVCGGTGFYIQSIVDGIVLPGIEANKKLRADLEKKDLAELQLILKNLDKKRFAEIDTKNKVRLVRAIEIACAIGKVPKLKKNPKYSALQIGVTWPAEALQKRIHDRLIKRLKIGMVKEVEILRKSGVSWKRLESFGLEYRYLALFLQNKITKAEMINELKTKINQFAKRQKTWFGRDSKINWFQANQAAKIERFILEEF